MGWSAVVVGAGGNIGSHLVPHLARMPGLDRLTLVDRDAYEAGNLSSQDITPSDVGRKKALVQADRARRINPALAVTAVTTPVETVPLGRLRSDVILACLDGRSARQHVNQAAWRLGVPWIDAGVDGGGLLARVDVYRPGRDNPCLECAWDERDYAALEQTYPCAPAAVTPAPTNAPSSLGALAASLQAIECQKLLVDAPGRSLAGAQVVLDVAHHKHYLTTLRRNPLCRLSDHEIWRIERLPAGPHELTVAKVFAFAAGRVDGGGPLRLRIEGQPFVRRLACHECRSERPLLRMASALRPSDRNCPRCGAERFASGLDLAEHLEAATLSTRDLARSLHAIGLRTGDVVSVGNGDLQVHLEV